MDIFKQRFRFSMWVALMTVAVCAMSAHASPWTFKVGASQVRPDVSSDLNIDVSDEMNLTGSIEYELMPNVIGEILLAVPFTHDIESVAGNTIGSFKHLPPTFSAKYNFATVSGLTPYVGAGLNYTFVFDEKLKGATLKGDDSFGFSALAGVGYQYPNSPWGVALDLRYISIESDLTINGASAGTLKVDPMEVSLSASYKC